MTTPIEAMIDAVLTPLERPDGEPEGLYATHSGVLEIGGHRLRCYRLNNGMAVFDADDFAAFFGGGR